MFSQISDILCVTLKQGELLSPLMSILFINDICYSLDADNLTQSDLNHFYMLLFADDKAPKIIIIKIIKRL